MSLAVRLVAVAWGFAWAAYLTFTRPGRWLAARRTWITVVIGVGVDLVILWRTLDRRSWWQMAEVIGLSAVGIILRSLIQEYRDGAPG